MINDDLKEKIIDLANRYKNAEIQINSARTAKLKMAEEFLLLDITEENFDEIADIFSKTSGGYLLDLAYQDCVDEITAED